MSNLSEHGRHKSVIRNILGTFKFGSEKLFEVNTTLVKAPVNIIPVDMSFFVVNESFEKVGGFTGWLFVEIIGVKKRNIE